MKWIKFAKQRPDLDPDRLIWVRYVAAGSYGVLRVSDAIRHQSVVIWWAEIKPTPDEEN